MLWLHDKLQYIYSSTYNKMIFRSALNFEDGMSLKGPPSSSSPLKLRGSIINTKLDEKGKPRKLFGQTGNGANLSRGKEKEQQEAFSSALGIKTVSQAHPGFLPSLASALSSSQDRFQTNFVGK